jgi:hypothetical protein
MCGYFQEPSKSIFAVQVQHNKEAAKKKTFEVIGHTVITGSCYFRGFIKEVFSQLSWVKEKTKD